MGMIPNFRFWFVLALACLATLSCGGLTNQYTGTQHLTIQSLSPGGSWSGWSQTTFQDSINTSHAVHVLSVTVESSSGEFSWLQSAAGTAPSGQLIVSTPPGADGMKSVPLDVDFTGDVRPLFVDSHTVKLDWAIQFADQLTQSYPDGLTLTVTYVIGLD
jgi:hypothetical protein